MDTTPTHNNSHANRTVRHHRAARLVVAVAASALAVACGSSESAPTPSTTTQPTTTAPLPTTTTPTTTSLPVTTSADIAEPVTDYIALGDDCSPVGSTATTEDGSTAYCTRLQGTDAYLWSLSPDLIPNPRLQTTTAPQYVILGDACPSTGATAVTQDGTTAYCARLQATDAHMWSSSPDLIPNPRLNPTISETSPGPSAGDDCSDANAIAVDPQGNTIYCNPTVNGRAAGNLLYQLQP